MTNWQKHLLKWRECQRCFAHEKSQHRCLLRGSTRADILFVGEAPGHSEDALNSVFVGPAGHLLDSMCTQANSLVAQRLWMDFQITLAFTNLVGCIPLGDDGLKIEQPSNEMLIACESRLVELLSFMKPARVVAVGKLAMEHLPRIREPDAVITHPAAILRMGDAFSQSTKIRETIQILAEQFISFVLEKSDGAG